jgi:hypothetical protein
MRVWRHGFLLDERKLHHREMNDMTRDEIELYLDAARAEAMASAAKVDASQAEIRADLKAGMAAISVDVANLKGDFHATFATHTKWIAAMGFGVIASLVAISSVFKSEPLPGPAPVPAPAPPPAPLVIYTQPLAPLLQPTPPLAPAPAPSPESHRH